MKVYLAGPMVGCDEKEIFGWRNKVAEELDDTNWDVCDPTIGTEFLVSNGMRMLMDNSSEGMNNDEVFHKDMFQLKQCDAILVNLEHLNGLSLGCFFEMGVAHALGMLIVVVNAGTRQMHPFVDIPCVNFDSLDEGIEFFKELF